MLLVLFGSLEWPCSVWTSPGFSGAHSPTWGCWQDWHKGTACSASLNLQRSSALLLFPAQHVHRLPSLRYHLLYLDP